MMQVLLAAEGGYQDFHLGGGEWLILIGSALTALLAVGVGFFLMRRVLAEDQGTPKMQEIAKAIQEGAMAYLKRQFKTILRSWCRSHRRVPHVDRGEAPTAASCVPAGRLPHRPFVLGCFLSGLTGFIGMSLAVRGNVRTAAAARSGFDAEALEVAFRPAVWQACSRWPRSVFGATVIIMIFQNTSSGDPDRLRVRWLALALFLRVGGGGIFTKAADVVPTSPARSKPGSLRTTAQPGDHRRQRVTTSATAPVWRPTCSSRTR
jgi:K(+)-stimulated pyrophosphate-energized sodium pump